MVALDLLRRAVPEQGRQSHPDRDRVAQHRALGAARPQLFVDGALPDRVHPEASTADRQLDVGETGVELRTEERLDRSHRRRVIAQQRSDDVADALRLVHVEYSSHSP